MDFKNGLQTKENKKETKSRERDNQKRITENKKQKQICISKNGLGLPADFPLWMRLSKLFFLENGNVVTDGRKHTKNSGHFVPKNKNYDKYEPRQLTNFDP